MLRYNRGVTNQSIESKIILQLTTASDADYESNDCATSAASPENEKFRRWNSGGGMKKTLILLEISLLFAELPVACGVFARGNQEFQQRQYCQALLSVQTV